LREKELSFVEEHSNFFSLKCHHATVTYGRVLPSVERFNDFVLLVTTTSSDIECHVAVHQVSLQIPAALAIPRVTDGVESLEVPQVPQFVQRQATQSIVPHVQMAQAAGERAQRAGLDALDAVAREHQLAERDEIAEPMGGDRGQPVADEREPLQLMQTGERARLDRADRAIVQIQTAQAVAEAEERVRGQTVDPQTRDLNPRRPVRQTVQRRQRARLETVSGTFLRKRKRERDKVSECAIAIITKRERERER